MKRKRLLTMNLLSSWGKGLVGLVIGVKHESEGGKFWCRGEEQTWVPCEEAPFRALSLEEEGVRREGVRKRMAASGRWEILGLRALTNRGNVGFCWADEEKLHRPRFNPGYSLPGWERFS